MKNILLQKDYDYLNNLSEGLKEESKKLTKKLGEYASHGGAVPFQIPEYQATDDRLRVIRDRFHQVNKALKSSEVVPFEKIDDKRIGLYCLVETEDEKTGNKERYYIVHSELIDELILDEGIFAVSPKSPVGKALIGKKPESVVRVELPRGTKMLKIIHFGKKEF